MLFNTYWTYKWKSKGEDPFGNLSFNSRNVHSNMPYKWLANYFLNFKINSLIYDLCN